MKIAVFYHCKIMGEGIPDSGAAMSIFREQMDALKNSGLLESADELYLGINGTEENRAVVSLESPCSKAHVILHGPGSRSELPTLAVLRRWLPDHPDWAVLYHHSKGVTQPKDPFHHHHRRTMEKFVVWGWKRCVADLDRGYDAVGCNLVDPDTRPVLPGRFFVGNFWWARSDYLLQLSPIPDVCHNYSNTQERCLAEGWIGNNSPRRPRMIDYERPELTWWKP